MADLVAGEWLVYSTVGTNAVFPPNNAVKADVVAIGAGGGGGFNNWGYAGLWASGTLDASLVTSVTVGAGGAAGGANDTPKATAGGVSKVGTLSASGGAAGTNADGSRNSAVSSAGSLTVFDTTFTGGAAAAANGAANIPGGGGGAGSSAKVGARGQVWIRWWVSTKEENLFVGSSTVKSVFFGSTEIKAVYSGSTLIYGSE